MSRKTRLRITDLRRHFQRRNDFVGPLSSSDSHAARRSSAMVPLFTSLRATLFFVAENQNVTLSVPRELLKRVKRLAADRETSVSALMTEALARLTDEDRRYSAARKRALGALKSARSLGTRGRRTWTRDELHER